MDKKALTTEKDTDDSDSMTTEILAEERDADDSDNRDLNGGEGYGGSNNIDFNGGQRYRRLRISQKGKIKTHLLL